VGPAAEAAGAGRLMRPTPLQQLRAHFGIRVAHADRPG
jgi:hypothetical protein